MTQVTGFAVENQGGSPATVIDPNSASTVVGATVTSKQFTMNGTYKLRGLPSTGGTVEVDVSTIEKNAAGYLTITPVSAASPASQFMVHTLLD